LQLIRCRQKADSSTAKRRFGMTNDVQKADRDLVIPTSREATRRKSAVFTTRIGAGSPSSRPSHPQLGSLLDQGSLLLAFSFSRRHFLISVSRPIAPPTFLKLWQEASR